MIDWFHKVEELTKIEKKLISRKWLQPLTIFAKHSIGDIWQSFEYVLGSEYALVLNIPKFWRCQGYRGLLKHQKHSWICPFTPEYTWMCLNRLEFLKCLKTFTSYTDPWINHGKLIRACNKNVLYVDSFSLCFRTAQKLA